MLEFWALVDNDLHETYGIDMWDDRLIVSRPWPWLRTRILGLLSTDSRLARALFPPQPVTV